jgi:hypothetical protein
LDVRWVLYTILQAGAHQGFFTEGSDPEAIYICIIYWYVCF